MKKDDYLDAYGTMYKYVKGKLPRELGYSWLSINHVYGIAFVLKCHWVAYDINILERRITVYDSHSKKKWWPLIAEEFKHVARFVPWVLNIISAGMDCGTRMKYTTWEIVQFADPPQQDNDYDCGVMALKYLECLVSGNPLDMIQPTQTEDYRKSYCF